jgi:hypothetical protein
MSDALEYEIIDAPHEPANGTEDPSPSDRPPLRLTPELLEKLSERSSKIRRIRRMVELSSRLPEQQMRRQKQKTRNRVKDAMAKASRKRNRRR